MHCDDTEKDVSLGRLNASRKQVLDRVLFLVEILTYSALAIVHALLGALSV